MRVTIDSDGEEVKDSQRHVGNRARGAVHQIALNITHVQQMEVSQNTVLPRRLIGKPPEEVSNPLPLHWRLENLFRRLFDTRQVRFGTN